MPGIGGGARVDSTTVLRGRDTGSDMMGRIWD